MKQEYLTQNVYSLFVWWISISVAVLEGKRMDDQVNPVDVSPVSDLGEGPHWDADQKALYYVDAFVGDVHRYDLQRNVDEKVNLGDLVTIVIPIENDADNLLVSLRNKIVKLNWKKRSFDLIAEVASDKKGKERFNDGKVDSLGRLWIGTVLEGDNQVVKNGGSLYKLEDNKFVSMSSNFTLSNGMAWNINNTLMYFNDSEERKTYVFDFDLQNGTIDNKRLFLDYNKLADEFSLKEFPDGMAIDSKDQIWISFYGGARVVCFDPQTGKILKSIHVPAYQTTSLAFGGANYSDIYVTSGSGYDQSDNSTKHPNAGQIFKITTNVQGSKAFNFKLQ